MPGIGIILNPHSKKHKQDPGRMERLGFIVGDRGSCRQTHSFEDLKEVISEFKQRQIEVLGIGGGDGTNHVVLTYLIRIYQDQPLPKITFLRGGTLNTIAASCGIYGSPEKILSNLIYKYHEDETLKIKEINLLEVNGEFGFIFGTGVLYRFMKSYYEGKPSPFRAAQTLGHSIFSAIFNTEYSRKMFERYEGEVLVDGKKWAFKNYSAIYAGSVEQLGLNFRVFHYSAMAGKFHAVGFSTPPRNILRYVPFMFLGKPSKCPELIEEPVSEMKMVFEEAQPYTLDGDMLEGQKEIIVRAGPKLQVVVV
ncbi:MAG: hypothetical protein HQM15_02490 [Deltaproteobacteria bacterium]|nr:hypothetical protein [Deltaproteobacteria bacterium]